MHNNVYTGLCSEIFRNQSIHKTLCKTVCQSRYVLILFISTPMRTVYPNLYYFKRLSPIGLHGTQLCIIINRLHTEIIIFSLMFLRMVFT